MVGERRMEPGLSRRCLMPTLRPLAGRSMRSGRVVGRRGVGAKDLLAQGIGQAIRATEVERGGHRASSREGKRLRLMKV
jgi:hypothetical protein